MAIKAVVFDVGKVVVSESGQLSRVLLAQKFGFDVEDFGKFAKRNLERSYGGKLEAVDFFEEFVKEVGLDVSGEDLVEGWKEIRRGTSEIDEGMVGLIKGLRESGLEVGSFTNTTKLNDVVRSELKIYDLFDFNVKSTEIGVVKPDRRAFEKFVEVLKSRGLSVEEVVFVDDSLENLEVAMEFGLKTVLFEGFESLEGKLVELGVGI